MGNFYDKIAKKYGGYGFTSNLPKHKSVYPNGNPEKIFKDSEPLKKVFGRGQNYGGWNNPRLESDRKELEGLDFKIVFMKDYLYTEYYLSKHEFVIFLQGVPIFEDFDFEKDKQYLNKYFSEFMQGDNVVLSRHRVVYVVQK